MLASSLLALPLLGLLPTPASAASYTTLVKRHEGSTFFDGFNFFGHYDNTTNGDVVFVNQSASADLAYVNDAGNVIIKVDNTSVVPYNEKRNTVKITTQDTYGIGSLWVFDATHVPYGCSVWPAFWSQAPEWPAGGEIDTFEGVNLQTTNQYALHTTSGCTVAGTSANQSGNLTYSNCDSNANGNSGCTVTEKNDASYGAAFAAAGGGVYATELAETGVSIWFFSRADVPSDLLASNTSAVPDSSTWGTPSAYYPNSGCSIDEYFSAQHLTLDITLCGDWAGSASVFNATCSGVCYTDWVLNATNYDTAYFEIQSLRIYNDGTNSSGNAGSSSSSSSNSSSGSSTPASSAVRLPTSTTSVVAGALFMALAWAVAL
ncbi:concanavalin A-like lectin/glucanase domain-containing protein [Leucosporidium creatinivorum]|uniref:Concanavalin A-like lectin/glucanase domain-containing protein n=1 Tax=Leucosporidium creatinivorum TaxID=106004 RepID=A0A1Y2FTW8_9BASI|nr:concanavalin A-like lectin/glucanase domain-containing protein [Leucosporidium creatinivorum]